MSRVKLSEVDSLPLQYLCESDLIWLDWIHLGVCASSRKTGRCANPAQFIMMRCFYYIVTCRVVHVTNKTGSSSDDWIYLHLVTHSHLITLTYSSAALSLIYTIYRPLLHTH
jgi:hypothetical protein